MIQPVADEPGPSPEPGRAATYVEDLLRSASAAVGVACVGAALVAALALAPLPEALAMTAVRIAALGVAGALVVVRRAGPPRRGGTWSLLPAAGALLVGAAVLADRWSAAACVAAGLSALAAAAPAGRATASAAFFAVWTAAALAVEVFLPGTVGSAGRWIGLASESHPLGAGYSGAPAALAASLAAAAVTRGAVRRAAAAVSVVAAWGAALHWVEPPSAWVAGCAAVAAGSVSTFALATPRPEGAAATPRGAWGAAAAVAAGALVSAGLAPHAADPGPVERRVVVLNEGGLDWNRPNYVRMGAFDSGMFGLLPEHLAQDGIRLEVAGSVAEFCDRLAGCDAGVVVNCPHVWTDEERGRVRSFLASGGGLLVLGDHTDVFGLQTGLDSLVGEYGIRFRFDSAHDLNGSWSADAIARPGSAFAARMPWLRHGIGASLDLRPPARPLVTGRFGFSDHGVRENHVGSMLGNYAVDDGEAIGDVCLVAESAGGRLVVYGDTSAFQNGCLPESYAGHLLPLFRALTGDAPPVGGGPARLAALALGAVGVLVIVRGFPARALLSFGVSAAVAIGAIAVPRVAPHATTARHALVDLTHANVEGHYDAGLNDLGPLYLHLQRFGLLPLSLREPARPGSERLRAVVAPADLADARADDLARYAADGGLLVVAAGAESGTGTHRFAASLDLELGEVLGAFPAEQRKRDAGWAPRLRRATRIVPGSPAWEPLVEQDGRVCAAIRPLGKGTVVWIGDPLFFGGPNVEGMWGAHPGNVRFLRRLLERLLGSDPEDVHPVFDSPRKPA